MNFIAAFFFIYQPGWLYSFLRYYFRQNEETSDSILSTKRILYAKREKIIHNIIDKHQRLQEKKS
jgi:hypothetical protein